MNLKIISDETLLRETQKLVAEERRMTTLILKHLAEIERRRLFAGWSDPRTLTTALRD